MGRLTRVSSHHQQQQQQQHTVYCTPRHHRHHNRAWVFKGKGSGVARARIETFTKRIGAAAVRGWRASKRPGERGVRRTWKPVSTLRAFLARPCLAVSPLNNAIKTLAGAAVSAEESLTVVRLYLRTDGRMKKFAGKTGSITGAPTATKLTLTREKPGQ